MNVEQKFIELIGIKLIEEIKNNNWVRFRISKCQIEMDFMTKDGKGDIVIHCSIIYDEETKKWWSENCIDYPNIKYNTFEEVKQHLYDIEDDILNNGFDTIEL